MVSVSALWCPLATPTILLGFLLPWAWGISSRLLQQSTATAPYLGRGVSPHHRPFWPWTWNSSSRSSCSQKEMARMNVDILGISELKCTGMGEFNSDDHYIYYCGQESLKSNGVALIVNRVQNAVLGYNVKNNTIISVHFQGKPIQYHSNPSLCPNQ